MHCVCVFLLSVHSNCAIIQLNFNLYRAVFASVNNNRLFCIFYFRRQKFFFFLLHIYKIYQISNNKKPFRNQAISSSSINFTILFFVLIQNQLQNYNYFPNCSLILKNFDKKNQAAPLGRPDLILWVLSGDLGYSIFYSTSETRRTALP